MASPNLAEVAYEAIKAKLSKLVEKLPPEEIADDLFSANVITEEVYEQAFDARRPRKDKARKLILCLMNAVKLDYSVFDRFCSTLEKSDKKGVHEWAKILRADIDHLLTEKSKITSNTVMTDDQNHLEQLKRELYVVRTSIYQSDENLGAKYDLAKEFITHYMQSFKGSFKDLDNQLKKLCFEEYLIPTKLHNWCMDELQKIAEKELEKLESSDSNVVDENVQIPLFTKEVVHHTMLLCKMVASCNDKSYESFLAHERHGFQEVSLSLNTIKNLERYAIAKKDDILYVALLGESSINRWLDKYSTMDEGISAQISNIPMLFLVESIREGYKIVFTGFSFGGLLAIALHSALWNQTCLTVDELKRNVVCIAFAPPLVRDVKIINSTLQKWPEIKGNTHLFYIKKDLIPHIFCSFDFEKTKSASSSSHCKLYAGAYGSVILKDLAEIQTNHFSSKFSQEVAQKHLKSLRSSLKEALPETKVLSSMKLFGTCYQIYSDSISGNVLTTLPDYTAEDQMAPLNATQIDEIKGDLFKHHSFTKYNDLVVQTYMRNDKFGPDVIKYNKDTTVSVFAKSPTASEVTLSRLGDEIALIVEGDHLWFCNHIKIGTRSDGRDIPIPAAYNAAKRSLNVNYTPQDENDELVDIKAEVLTVHLYSHFCNPIKKDVKIIRKGNYEVSHRQRQLACYTPMQVIILSFLSAMLEKPTAKYKKTGRRSKRLTSISTFLEEVVHIVPVESICHAITNTEPADAWQCAEALAFSSFKPPPSLSLLFGLENACLRLKVGAKPQELDKLRDEAMKGIKGKFTACQTTLRVSPDNVAVTATPLLQLPLPYSEVVKNPYSRSYGLTASMTTNPYRSYSHTVSMERNLYEFASHTDKAPTIVNELHKMRDDIGELCEKCDKMGNLDFVCGYNISELYHANTADNSSSSILKSPIAVLVNAKEKLSNFQKEAEKEIQSVADEEDTINSVKALYNEKMVEVVDDVYEHDLSICVSLLGAFMEEQIRVPFINSPQQTARILQRTKTPSTVGVWALFSLRMLDLKKMLENGEALVVEVQNYIQGILSEIDDQTYRRGESRYAGKLQFLMQGMASKSVGCNTSYISYSLERQLRNLCKTFDVKSNMSVKDLVSKWDEKFKSNVLFYVMKQYRPLLARWLIWSLRIHKLREELASHTTVGIVGLSNSGKSSLVSALFKQKIIAGSTAIQRTTIPFLYNLEGYVDGFSVIDFPGMDDKDKSVQRITKLLLQLAQIVIVVIDYRRYTTVACKEMLDLLNERGIPVLLCLSHGDKLYANECLRKHGRDCSSDVAKREIAKEFDRIKKKIGVYLNQTIGLYSFSQDGDSFLDSKEGRETLRNVGIKSFVDVGEWIENELRNYMKQSVVADNLRKFLNEPESLSPDHESLNDINENTPVFPLPIPDIRGVTISDEITIQFSGSKSHQYDWKGYGFKIFVPSGAIPDDLTYQLTVRAVTHGQFNFPKNTEQVSAIYWIHSTHRFQKPVDVSVEHCAILETADNCDCMKFVIAYCNQELPYDFQPCKGAFSLNNREGLISLRSFSFLAIIRDYFYPSNYSLESGNDQNALVPFSRNYYVITIFARCAHQGKVWHFDCVIMKDCAPYIMDVCNNKYKDWDEEIQPYTFEFATTSLNLKTPSENEFPGWKIVHKKQPSEIKKDYVDKSTSDSCLQTHRIGFRWVGQGDPDIIDCPIQLIGAKDSPTLTVTVPIGDISKSCKTQCIIGRLCLASSSQIVPHENAEASSQIQVQCNPVITVHAQSID